jgi:hypothetical protein
MTDTELLETAGRALFGADWHRGLARALSVNDSSVRNWMHGRNAVPPGIWDDLSRLLEDRAREIVDVLALVDAFRARLWASTHQSGTTPPENASCAVRRSQRH